MKYIHRLEREAFERETQLIRLQRERKLLAKLAAKGPTFNSPLDVWCAEILCDKILRDECGLNPDGTPIARGDGEPSVSTGLNSGNHTVSSP